MKPRNLDQHANEMVECKSLIRKGRAQLRCTEEECDIQMKGCCGSAKEHG